MNQQNSVSEYYDRTAVSGDAQDLEIVWGRLARLDSGKSIAQPWDHAMSELFPTR